MPAFQKDDVFLRFAERLASGMDANDLHAALAEAAFSLDLPTFAYLSPSSSPERKTDLISSYPSAWTNHYLRNHYEAVDPVVHQARRGHETFRWGAEEDGRDLSLPQRQLLDEARQFGIHCGFTVPIHDGRGSFAALTFASDERRPLFFRLTEKYELALRLIASVFHLEAREILLNSWIANDVVLSRRETECMRWASEGKSAWEIGRILGISQRTSSFHLENAKKKFGVPTIKQACALFARSRR